GYCSTRATGPPRHFLRAATQLEACARCLRRGIGPNSTGAPMKLLGTNFTAPELMARIEGRLRARGLWSPPESPPPSEGIEPPVDPLSFNLQALEEHADPT